MVADGALANALLGAYERVSRRLSQRLYIPIVLVRDELRTSVSRATKAELNAVLCRAPHLLPDYIVTFSPFSGPARGGVSVRGMYAGFISIRPKAISVAR